MNKEQAIARIADSMQYADQEVLAQAILDVGNVATVVPLQRDYNALAVQAFDNALAELVYNFVAAKQMAKNAKANKNPQPMAPVGPPPPAPRY